MIKQLLETKERVVCSAIKVIAEIDGEVTERVFNGVRHPSILLLPEYMDYLKEVKTKGTFEAIQGFTTNKVINGSQFRFVDREEAKKIALEAGQIEDLKEVKSKLAHKIEMLDEELNSFNEFYDYAEGYKVRLQEKEYLSELLRRANALYDGPELFSEDLY